MSNVVVVELLVLNVVVVDLLVPKVVVVDLLVPKVVVVDLLVPNGSCVARAVRTKIPSYFIHSSIHKPQ